MVASQLISDDITPLRTSDSGEEAIAMMNVYHVRHLPIVNNESFLGIVSEDDVLDHDMFEPIGSYKLSALKPHVHETDHFFDVMRKIAAFNLTVIPVIDDDDNYVGIITIEDLMKFYASSFSFNEMGGIIVLKVHRSNYSLAEIARIVEENNAIIISSFISNDEMSNNLLISLKLNTNQLSAIKASFERYEYDIHASYTETEEFDMLKDRYDALMKYLSV